MSSSHDVRLTSLVSNAVVLYQMNGITADEWYCTKESYKYYIKRLQQYCIKDSCIALYQMQMYCIASDKRQFYYIVSKTVVLKWPATNGAIQIVVLTLHCMKDICIVLYCKGEDELDKP